MNHISVRLACVVLAASLGVASCSDSGPAAPEKKWGVGGELAYDSYSVDEASGFWRTTPDSTVRYRLASDKHSVDGRSNVRMFVSSSDTIMIARTAHGDAEMRLPQFEVPIGDVPVIWAPLPFATKRDTTFLDIDSSIIFGGFTVKLSGTALSHYGGSEGFAAAGIEPMTTERTDVRGSLNVTALVINGGIELEGEVWYVPANDIVTRIDMQTETTMPGATEKMRAGRSLRLKQIVYP